MSLVHAVLRLHVARVARVGWANGAEPLLPRRRSGITNELLICTAPLLKNLGRPVLYGLRMGVGPDAGRFERIEAGRPSRVRHSDAVKASTVG